MATAADKNSRTPAQKSAAPAAKGGSKLPLIISAVAVLAAAGAGGGWYWSSSKAAAAEHAAAEAAKPKLPAPAQYLALEPPCVVNLNGATGGPQPDQQLTHARQPGGRGLVEQRAGIGHPGSARRRHRRHA